MIENGINIDTLYTKSDTVDGIRILKHIGFTEVPSLSTKFRNYTLRMNEEGKQLLEKYKHTLYKTPKPQPHRLGLFLFPTIQVPLKMHYPSITHLPKSI